MTNTSNYCCISFYSYIKPQHVCGSANIPKVVYRSIPTSNRNKSFAFMVDGLVVYRSIPTSNRNDAVKLLRLSQLYIVLFLHQTATLIPLYQKRGMLYIVLFLHQTATSSYKCLPSLCCISFYSYIKPQRAV